MEACRGRIKADVAGHRLGAKRVAVINGGTIPDRGLYGVFLLGERGPAARVGELDEEMVFESRVGETFVLGASSWRIEEITHDRVLVTGNCDLGQQGPFWKRCQTWRAVRFTASAVAGSWHRGAISADVGRRRPADG